MRVFVGVIAAGVFAGCAVPDQTIDVIFDPCEPLAIAIDPETRDDERASVLEAIERWNERAGTWLTAGPAAGEPQIPLRFEEASPLVYGVYLDETGEILINRALTRAGPRTITIAHEIGHAFGLEHVGESIPSLMNPGNLDVELTETDLEALVDRWGECPAPTTEPGRAGGVSRGGRSVRRL